MNFSSRKSLKEKTERSKWIFAFKTLDEQLALMNVSSTYKFMLSDSFTLDVYSSGGRNNETSEESICTSEN